MQTSRHGTHSTTLWFPNQGTLSSFQFVFLIAFLHDYESCSFMSDSLQPLNSPCQNTGMASLSLLQGIFPTQGLNPGLPHCRWILYCQSHPGKPRNTGVGSLSLLQGIFPTQKLNWGLLHYRWVLYQLSHQGSPGLVIV